MTALILVDLQNDFMPGGRLPVAKGLEILPAVGKLVTMPFDKIVATKDWHPPGHGSFASTHKMYVGDEIDLFGIRQVLWPDHCIQGSFGAEFHSGWDHSKVEHIFHKGSDPNIDSYSTFFDNGNRKSTGLEDFLKDHRIRRVVIAGLATDYCVKYSVFDAVRLGFETFVVPEGCRGVNLDPNDDTRALDEMKKLGAKELHLSDVEKMLRGGGI